MTDFRVVTDLEECRYIWQKTTPTEVITDLWDVRECFHRHYRNKPHFIVAEDEKGISGVLPLCWIDEQKSYQYFPGETWHGKTWLEQNRIFARDGILPALLDQCPSPHNVRYLLPDSGFPENRVVEDEIGYLFFPPKYEYNIENYYAEFSPKSSKRLKKDIACLEELGAHYRFNNLSDFDYIADLNVQRFGKDSYFSDPRFKESFRSFMHYLNDNGFLRITTVMINNIPAAVDIGCIYRNTYTLLGGGTHADYPGIAKVINVYHMKYACEQKFDCADFLCGDFSWKKLFHLTPRPLYVMSNLPAKASEAQNVKPENTNCLIN